METPLSTRRITRSQTTASATNDSNLLMPRKVEESDKCVTKSRQINGKKQQQDRFVLTDITNDSPIVGVAKGNLETTSSAMSKKRSSGQVRCSGTPGSGEALLRGQVKNLLQKVEEGAELSKITIDNRPFFNNFQGLVKSPCISLVAPTPANTPQVLNFSSTGGVEEGAELSKFTIDNRPFFNNFQGLVKSPCISLVAPTPANTPQVLNFSATVPPVDEFLIPQMTSEMLDETKQEGVESDNVITRSLLLDFSEKSESSDSSGCSSALTYQGQISKSSIKKPSSDDDDDASIWSVQSNASSTREDDEEEEYEQEQEGGNFLEDEYAYEEEKYADYGDDDDILDDDLCEGISKISFHGIAKFAGKHIRFVYNSDDEEHTEADLV